MTPSQRDTLAFITGYIARTGGVPPTYDEIAAHLGLKSKSGIHRLIAGLVERGHIEKRPHLKRCIRVIGGPATVDELCSLVSKLVDENGPETTAAALLEMAGTLLPQEGTA